MGQRNDRYRLSKREGTVKIVLGFSDKGVFPFNKRRVQKGVKQAILHERFMNVFKVLRLIFKHKRNLCISQNTVVSLRKNSCSRFEDRLKVLVIGTRILRKILRKAER